MGARLSSLPGVGGCWGMELPGGGRCCGERRAVPCCPSVPPCVHLAVHLPLRLSIHLSVHPSSFPPQAPSLCPPAARGQHRSVRHEFARSQLQAHLHPPGSAPLRCSRRPPTHTVRPNTSTSPHRPPRAHGRLSAAAGREGVNRARVVRTKGLPASQWARGAAERRPLIGCGAANGVRAVPVCLSPRGVREKRASAQLPPCPCAGRALRLLLHA